MAEQRPEAGSCAQLWHGECPDVARCPPEQDHPRGDPCLTPRACSTPRQSGSPAPGLGVLAVTWGWWPLRPQRGPARPEEPAWAGGRPRARRDSTHSVEGAGSYGHREGALRPSPFQCYGEGSRFHAALARPPPDTLASPRPPAVAGGSSCSSCGLGVHSRAGFLLCGLTLWTNATGFLFLVMSGHLFKKQMGLLSG